MSQQKSMSRPRIAVLAALALAATATALPANAMPLRPASAPAEARAAVETVQYRRGPNNYRNYPPPPRQGYYRQGYTYGPGYRNCGWGGCRNNNGAAVAAGVIGGLALGAAAAANANSAPPPNSAAAYCAQRFRSYDPRSGTYMGYDGIRRSCP